MMLSGQSATIEAVEEIPYREVMDTAQGGAAALTSTQFKNVGVTLKVTATITDDNDIFLAVEAEHNVNTGTSDGGVPVVDTRKANTALLLKDGQIVIMGGLRREEKIHETNKIPLLGDLPILGWLFKNDNPVTSNSELIVLVSPHIHRGQRIPEETMAKYNYIRNKSLLGAAPGKQ
jgi:type II secretory pathway component GspD/PulD (secretin)